MDKNKKSKSNLIAVFVVDILLLAPFVTIAAVKTIDVEIKDKFFEDLYNTV